MNPEENQLKPKRPLTVEWLRKERENIIWKRTPGSRESQELKKDETLPDL